MAARPLGNEMGKARPLGKDLRPVTLLEVLAARPAVAPLPNCLQHALNGEKPVWSQKGSETWALLRGKHHDTRWIAEWAEVNTYRLTFLLLSTRPASTKLLDSMLEV
ncbi:MAG: hypothetical protein JSS66_06195 [Armatimonadetes bacterium]|nr:hypothetical protein [Armatimonadota bacterium]